MFGISKEVRKYNRVMYEGCNRTTRIRAIVCSSTAQIFPKYTYLVILEHTLSARGASILMLEYILIEYSRIKVLYSSYTKFPPD